MIDDDEIRILVAALARPHRSGGHVVERAAILAAGSDASAVVEWIIAHGGTPEAPDVRAVSGGLHGAREREGDRLAPPSRYLVPAEALH